jgi:23S rRNA (cytidine2498-2'-O)-methyltransferase
VVTPGPVGPPRTGEWLWTCRAGAEVDLIEELFYLDPKSAPRKVADALVASARRPKSELAFARQGLPIIELVHGTPSAPLPHALGRALVRQLLAGGRTPEPWTFDLFVPDSDEGNPLSGRAEAAAALALSVVEREAPAWAALHRPSALAAHAENGLLATACLFPPGDTCALGLLPTREAQSLAPGGRLRVHVPKAAPSRAAHKLLEAFAWLDRGPEPGDVCVDLGAAPGGWSYVLLERRAKVIAVDPARMARELAGKKNLDHIQADAFLFDPGESVDWLFSDMAWRPLEAAALLAKWARKRWARLLIANIKLPMKKKAEYLFRVREILEEGGWTSVRARQLYHDREEVTVAAVRI